MKSTASPSGADSRASVSGKTAGLRENAVWPVKQMAIAANVIDFNFISFVYNVAE